ncbi:hypothetical protein H2198_005480 [Neophaeococcomyces mojaviensis]|uniref:Uncharacterized protein n=1 Tax=Neophaeococcomyces mojaviensis TaxID=3383035 RepID=A0ACC3A5Q4_9EURO|nr:hypothetical protein H2198_005480 [Knufia sp. JES_112]
MAPQTRSGQKASAAKPNSKDTKPKAETAGAKRKRKDQPEDKTGSSATEAGEENEPPAKKPEIDHKKASSDKLDKILLKYGTVPLSDLGLESPTEPTPETVLAHLLNAMLTSARISHELATKTVKEVFKANYHHLDILKKSSWQERTEVLTDGGYTRYREKTATALGELADLISDKYHSDLNFLREKADDSPDKIRKLVKEVKGFGDVGVNIFCDSAQAIWPSLAPFIDPRSLQTAKQLGLGNDVDKLYAAVGKDPLKMAQLCTALTTIRLDKREAEFE